MPGTGRINKIRLPKGKLKGGNLIPITILIYGTEMEMFITPNTEAVYVYNVVSLQNLRLNEV
jgi:hypothetical protein